MDEKAIIFYILIAAKSIPNPAKPKKSILIRKERYSKRGRKRKRRKRKKRKKDMREKLPGSRT